MAWQTSQQSKAQGTAERIRNAGYKVKEKSPWHLHVRKKGDDLLVNVWPTVNKIMVDRAGGASVYKDVLESLDQIFKREAPPMPVLPEWQQDLVDEIQLYRKNPLKWIKEVYAV